MSVHLRIREARKALNISQKDFAKAICISNSYLADVENGYRKANDRIVKLASITFGISENWLKTGEGEIFYKSPDEKLTRLESLFNQLTPDFQDYILLQIEQLIETRKKERQNEKNRSVSK
jgi:transcriptional regulator with XRE-family HTH domain